MRLANTLKRAGAARTGFAAALFWGALCGAPLSAADIPCRQALSLGLDVSGSVDKDEWRLQIEGLAQALEAPEVIAAFLAMPDVPVYLHIFEWAGSAQPRDVLDWVAIKDADALAHVARDLRDWPKLPQPPETALGAAMQYGGQKLAQVKGCWRYTLDISADGRSNLGPRPHIVRQSALLRDVTINALVISAGSESLAQAAKERDLRQLTRYFHDAVIQGPGAFVEPALSYDQYRETMTRKLLKELQTVTVGQSKRQ